MPRKPKLCLLTRASGRVLPLQKLMRRELNIPNRDRRARRRLLTLKNARLVVLGLVLLTVGVVLYARRQHGNAGDYGRLFGKQVTQPQVQAPRHLAVVTEAPVPDQTVADPLLVAPAAREQYLGVDQQPGTPAQAPPELATPAPKAVAVQQGDRVAVVGDPSCGSIHRTTGAATTKLRSGFGRPQEVAAPGSGGSSNH